MKYKEFAVQAAADAGTIEGYASTWDREPDCYGDIVAKGAFLESLTEWKESGKRIPLLWAHQMNELGSFIGSCDADEDEKGLHFVGSFDDTPEAQRTRQLYLDGRLSKFSFAYDVLDEQTVTLEDGRKANELQKLKIHEISCVCVPANPYADVLEVKAGRRNRKSDEQIIHQIIELAQELLGQNDTEGENDADDNAKAEDQKAEINLSGKNRILEIIKSLEGKER